MNFLETLFGSGPKQGSTYNQGQLSLIDQIVQQIKGMQSQGAGNIQNNAGYGQAQEWLNSLFNDPSFFQNMEAPAFRQFNEEIVPGLANRFASMGSGGALGSTGFRNQLAREGSNLATNLAANRAGLQQQGVNQQLGYAQQPVNNFLQMLQQSLQPTQNTYTPATSGLLGPTLGAAAGGFGVGAGNWLGKQFAGQNPSTF